MHDSAFRIGELVMRTYSDLANARILEVGALDVNGCLRHVAMPTTHYVGLDLEEGPSVDFVIAPGTAFPVEDDSFDLVMASSVFEHDARFWDTFLRMCRAARAGGHIYINAPSNGTVHRYPMDCWRFYPDAGLALADYARSEGFEIDLIESFVARRHSDVWNDFVAVFRKGPSAEPLNTAFVYHRYPSHNARTWQSRAVYNESTSTEDMVLIEDLRCRSEELTNQMPELERAQAALIEEHERSNALAEEAARLSAALTEAEQRTGLTDAEKEYLTGQVATLESNLRQRQEEIEQAWTQAEQFRSQRDDLAARIEQLETTQDRLKMRLAKADGWVFDLAGERRKLELRLAAVRSELEGAQRSIADMQGRIDAVGALQQQLRDHRTTDRRIFSGVAQLKALDTEPGLLRAQAERLYQAWSEEAHPLSDLAGFIHSLTRSTHIVATEPTFAAQENAERENMNAIIEQKGRLHEDVEKLMERLDDRERQIGEANERIAELSDALDTILEEKAGVHADAEKLLEKLTNSEQTLSLANERIAGLTDALASVRSDARNHQAKAAQALERLEVLRAEHVQKSQELQALEDENARKDRQLDWMRRLFQFLERNESGWQAILPPRLRRARKMQTLQRNAFFDGDAYLDRHPDVAAAGENPLRHYVLHGMAEGRPIDSQTT